MVLSESKGKNSVLQSHAKQVENKMMVRSKFKKVLILSIVLLTMFLVYSQELADSTETEKLQVFAPFVSKIRTSIRDPEIKITWEDNQELDGTYQIYRYTEEINNDNITNAVLVSTMEKGIEEYIDAPPDNGIYYYAIVSLDTNGNAYEVFVPFRNKTIIPTQIALVGQEATPALAEASSTTSPESSIISARMAQGSVVINYNNDTDESLTLYRTNSLPETFSDLETSVQINLTGVEDFPFSDYPLPEQSYYYVVLTESERTNSALTIESGIHRIESPIMAALGNRISNINRGSSREVRNQNLPILHLSTNSLGSRLPDSSQEISSDTNQALSQLLRPFPVQEERAKNPEILALEKPQNRSQYETLQSVVMEDFQNNDWNSTVEKLGNFRTYELTPEIDFLSRFYIAQSLYFNGEIEASYLEFILIQDTDPTVIDPWVSLSLSKMAGSPGR